MKKLISTFIFTLVFFLPGQTCRLINNFDIARWYLDADLVLICDVRQTETINISHFDSLADDGFHIIYDINREKYHISIDSVIKGKQLIDGTMDSIFTPKYSTQVSREKIEFSGLDANGDSIYSVHFESSVSLGDDHYFRINSQEKQLVILRKTSLGYVIDYTSECDEITMNLISEVNKKGEGYFTSFLQLQADTLPVYDHYCESMNPYEIDTTTFKYQSDTLYIRNVKSEFCCPGKLLAVVKRESDTLDINVINPSNVDCACDCSYGYTVKVQMAPFDTLHLKINNEDFEVTKENLELSAQEALFQDICVYPNPFKEKLHITGIQPERIEVTNMNGQREKIEIQDPQSIDLSNLRPGVYILTVFNGKTTWREKIIKE